MKDFRMLAGLQPERGEGVPEIVEADVWEVGTLEERLEVPRGEVVAVHRATAQRRESLMERAFGLKSGLLRLSEEDQEQLGAMQIYRGVMAFFRNAAGHNLIETYDQEDALRFVVFVDLLLAMVGKVAGD